MEAAEDLLARYGGRSQDMRDALEAELQKWTAKREADCERARQPTLGGHMPAHADLQFIPAAHMGAIPRPAPVKGHGWTFGTFPDPQTSGGLRTGWLSFPMPSKAAVKEMARLHPPAKIDELGFRAGFIANKEAYDQCMMTMQMLGPAAWPPRPLPTEHVQHGYCYARVGGDVVKIISPTLESSSPDLHAWKCQQVVDSMGRKRRDEAVVEIVELHELVCEAMPRPHVDALEAMPTDAAVAAVRARLAQAQAPVPRRKRAAGSVGGRQQGKAKRQAEPKAKEVIVLDDCKEVIVLD